MRRNFYSLYTTMVMVATLLVATTALAASYIIDSETVNSITSIDGNRGNTVLQCTIGSFDSEELTINDGTYHSISLEGQPRFLEAGAPALPYLTASIVLPDAGSSTLEILQLEYTDFPGLQPEPSKGNLTRDIDPATVPYTFGSTYRSTPFPVVQTELGTPYILRDFRGQVVRFQPFQWLPQENVLRVYHQIIVQVTTGGRSGENQIERATLPAIVDDEFHTVYQRHFINFDNMERYEPLEEQGALLIIAHDSFYDTMLPLVEWKLQKGIPTEIVNLSEVGNTGSQLLSYVQDYYDNQGLTFLLLVGDAEDVPYLSAAGGASDPSLSLLDGADSYPDIFVGRFCGETPGQIATMVERSVEYERDATALPWHHQGMGVASNQGPGDDGEYDNEHVDNIRDLLLAYTYTEVDQIYDPSGTADMVANGLNEGRSIINYCGHGSTTSWGSTGFSNSHVNTLVNDNMLPFIQSVACVNGQFVGTTCFAEAWLRATDVDQPTGAIAMYASTINMSWNPPMSGQDEFNDLLVADEKHSYGGLCYNGSMQMIDDYGAGGINEFLTWTIFGDPSLIVCTDSPAELTVLHTGAMMSVMPSYDVTVTGTEGALCSLYGDGIFYGSALTGAGGNATITLLESPAVGATLTLTITAYNHTTYQGEVNIIPPEGPYVIFDECFVMDINAQLNPGEEPWLSLVVLNLGVAMAEDVNVTLLTDDQYVTLIDAEEFYGDIEAGETATVEAGFQLAVSPETPDGHTVLFTLQAADGREMWESSFILTVYAPVLAISGIIIIDGNNGVLEPGESVELEIALLNTGSGSAEDINALLSSSDEFTTIDIADCPLPDIDPEMEGSLIFGITMAAETPIGHAAQLLLELSGDYYFEEELFYLGVGHIEDGFESGDFTGAPWEMAGDVPWTIVTEDPFEGVFCARSGVIGNDAQSELYVQVIQSMDHDISFRVKTSSQSGSDRLQFSVDGTEFDSWSGLGNWQEVVVPLTAGSHQLSWNFSRDGSGGGGENCAWIDLVSFPPVGFPPDTNPPVIFHTPLVDNDNAAGPWIVNAILHDPSGLTAEVEYRFNGAAWNSIPLTDTPGDCSAAIPGPAAIGTLIEYWILAEDNSDNGNFSTSEIYSFVIEAPHGIEYCQDWGTADFEDWTVEDWGEGNSWELFQNAEQGYVAGIMYSNYGVIEHSGLISPVFDCSNQATLEFGFWQNLRMGYTGSWTLATVWGSIDGGATWSVMLAQWDSGEYGDVEIITDELVDITSWAAGEEQVRFMFEYEAEYDWYWYLDDICLNGVLQTAPDPITDLQISWITGDTMQLYWSPIAEADSYNIYQSAQPQGPWDFVATVTQSNYGFQSGEVASGFFQVTWLNNRVTGTAPTIIDLERGMRPATPMVK